MNDFDYDAMQKKRVANSARKRVNGSRSRMCSLPSDNLTPAQQKKLNGECKSWNLNEPMDWETFKAMPHDLQVQYVRGLHSRFGVGLRTVSMDMFHGTNSLINVYFKRNGIKYSSEGKRLGAEERKVWENWLSGGLSAETEEPQEVVEQDGCREWSQEDKDGYKKFQQEVMGSYFSKSNSIKQYTPDKTLDDQGLRWKPSSFEMATFTVEWSGEFDAAAFVHQLARLPIPTGRVKIHLEVVKE